MPKRDVCKVCKYPKTVCLCASLIPTDFKTELVILQHPSETSQAKNTARLIALVANATEIIVGETEQDFSAVRARLSSKERAIVIFPSSTSMPLSTLPDKEKVKTIILIDGTWRKAKKIWHSNPWLQTLPVCALDGEVGSSYRIRKSREVGGFSTLEAAALALELIEGANTDPLYAAFEAMQGHWQGFKKS